MRPESLTTLLRRGHVADPARAERLLRGPLGRALALALHRGERTTAQAVSALALAADPDQAVLGLVRLGEAVGEDRLAALLVDDDAARANLIALLGGSAALGDWLVGHPGELDAAARVGEQPDDAALRAILLRAVGADPGSDAPVAADVARLDAMRVAYRREIVGIAVRDLTSPDPVATLPATAAALAGLAAAALEAALALSRAALGEDAAKVRLAVLGMGKTGARELNYISDVDVIYVAEPADGVGEDEAMRLGTRLAQGLATACTRASAEPALWEVDPNLRPEGRQGPLVRTLASHVAYYRRWAKTWEFQALLKARHVAGDVPLADDYLAAVGPMVWDAVGRENFVEDAQAMRRRVEQHVPAAEAERQIKLGRGGLRDVEFTVQLLQLVHGRLDERIRSSSTLAALDALAAGGYVGRDDAEELGRRYRFLRLLEHRIQLWRMRRTHLLPTAEADLRRLARSAGAEDLADLEARWRSTRREVRRLHEELFYRPLLPATARLSADEAALSPEAAAARLSALGYRDARGALRHIAALTEGVSRRAAIQRQLLPVLLGWFADGADPDAGLLAFRRVSDDLGTTHWYLKLLRDSGAAAERLARVLASSRYVADLLTRSPESVAWLGDDAELAPRGEAALATAMRSVLARKDEQGEGAQALLALRRRELTRAALTDVLDGVPVGTAAAAITPAADVALAGALRIATVEANRAVGLEADPAAFLVVAMGRLGGREIGYASDADVLFVHRPHPGADAALAERWAVAVASTVRAVLGATGGEPPLPVDADLRPEGRNGPITRTLASYAEYYARWAHGWERQALLRARPVAGDEALTAAFLALIDPLRYPAGGIDDAELKELRRIKARVESERLPRGVEPTRHLKLGRGGLADVEWAAQLLQLRHADAVPALRTTSTLTALDAAAGAGLIAPGAAEELAQAWSLATRIRNANVLWTGRTNGAKVDVLPTQRADLAGLAQLLRLDGPQELETIWLRTARHARAAAEGVLYGSTPGP